VVISTGTNREKRAGRKARKERVERRRPGVYRSRLGTRDVLFLDLCIIILTITAL
jgi:hypothetical protein